MENEKPILSLLEVIHPYTISISDLEQLLRGYPASFLSEFFSYTRHYKDCLRFTDICRNVFLSHSAEIPEECDKTLIFLKLHALWHIPDYPQFVLYFENVLENVHYFVASIHPPADWDKPYFRYYDGNYYYYHFLCIESNNYKRAKSGNGPRRRRKPLSESEYQKRLQYLKRVLPIYMSKQ